MNQLLCIHGTGVDGSCWVPILPMLSQRYDVITYDRRGYGRPHGDHAEDARDILDQRAPGQPAFVVGWSAGAIVALELAVRHPSRVRGLVLMEPPLWASRDFDPRLMLTMLKVFWNVARKRPREAAATFFRAVTRYRDGSGSAFDNGPAALRDHLLSHADDVIAELRAGTGEALTPARLRTITCPTTLLVGDRSADMFRKCGRKLAAAMPQLRTVVIPGVSHAMMYDAAQPVADAIIEADTTPPSSPAT